MMSVARDTESLALGVLRYLLTLAVLFLASPSVCTLLLLPPSLLSLLLPFSSYFYMVVVIPV